jgi:glycosyltransferase involved in cell wall biosynthesis
VDFLVHRSFRSFQQGGLTPTRKLRVAYMLPHHNITGGMKCLVEHIRLLRSRGHTTIAVHRSDTAVRAMPPWTSEEADVDVVCRLHQRLADVYPATDIDVCVVGIFHQVAELLMGVPAPVVYWEQGHEWVFGDPIRFQEAHNYKKQDQLFHMVMHLPCALAAVSEAVQTILGTEFGRQPLIIPNGIDCHRFTPGPRSHIPPTATMLCVPGGQGLPPPPQREGEKSVLLVGNPALPLKGFDVALAALAAVHRVLPIRVTWVCQSVPSAAHLPVLPACGLTLDLHVSPPQEDLAALYRGHDAMLFTSRYEAWGMPVMEAMASGLAVVATRCLGVATFAQHAQNCLLADTQDVLGLAQALLRVLTDEKLRARLALAARHTALRFTPEAITDRLEAVLYSLTAVSSEVLALRHPALGPLQLAASWASTACAKPSPHPGQQAGQAQRQAAQQQQQQQLGQQPGEQAQQREEQRQRHQRPGQQSGQPQPAQEGDTGQQAGRRQQAGQQQQAGHQQAGAQQQAQQMVAEEHNGASSRKAAAAEQAAAGQQRPASRQVAAGTGVDTVQQEVRQQSPGIAT